MHQLLIRDARLLDGRIVDISIENGRYARIADPSGSTQSSAGTGPVLEADGRLVTESFVNGHMHLEKVYTLPMVGDAGIDAYTSGAMGGAMTSIEIASAAKKQYDRSWIEPNVRRALDEAVRYGTSHVLAFVDVDTTAGLTGMEAVLAVREEYRARVDLQVVAFPQDGLIRDEGAAELCEEALRMGADVVGGIPWIEHTDADSYAHVDWACSLAAAQGKRVAMLVDDAGDPSLRTTGMLAEAMIRHGLAGRGVACHARALGLYPEPTLLRLVGLARKAGLGFVSDPHTGPLHLPVRRFIAEGLPVALGQDDIEDAYYPFGRHNMLEVAFLAAHILGFLGAVEQLQLIELVTTRAADVLGIEAHSIAPGNVANLCVHDCERVVDLLRHHAAPRWVVRDGGVVAEGGTLVE